MLSYCGHCKQKMIISELMANAKGGIWLEIKCLQCDETIETESTMEKVKKHCFDLDFLNLIKIKGEN